MKVVRIALLLLGLSVAPAWAGQTSNVYELRVDGLGCPFCAYGIEKTLSSVSGVDTIDVDIRRGVVIVTMAAGATLDEAVANEAVEKAGFTLRGFERAEPSP